MQAIITKYLGPTNFRAGRIKAKCQARSIVVEWDYALNPENNHKIAAEKLANMLGWDGQWVGGDADGSGYVFVCNDPRFSPIFMVSEQEAAA